MHTILAALYIYRVRLEGTLVEVAGSPKSLCLKLINESRPRPPSVHLDRPTSHFSLLYDIFVSLHLLQVNAVGQINTCNSLMITQCVQ